MGEPNKFLKAAIAAATLLGGMPDGAEAKTQKSMSVERADAELGTTPATQWVKHLLEKANADLKEVSRDKNPKEALARWYNAYPEKLFNDYSGPFRPGEEPTYSADDYAVLAQAVKAMSRLVAKAENAQGLGQNRTIADGLDRMRVSVADRLVQAKAQSANGPLAQK